MTLWRIEEAAAAMAASAQPAAADGDITGISIDTRSLQSGDLFFALRGDPGPRFNTSSPGSRDGHEFVAAAFDAGAVAAVMHEPRDADSDGVVLQVGDTLDALWDLGRASVARHQGLRFAVTGSSGKTTAKTFLAQALGAALEPGSLNNFWGVPLCLARTHRDAAHAVYEIGTNGPGEIEPLSRLCAPSIAMLLNVHPAHIGNFSSLEALTVEKCSIAAGLAADGVFVCPVGLAEARTDGRTLTFGTDRRASVRTVAVEGDLARYEIADQTLTARVPGGGAHRAETLGAVMAALLAADLDPQLATELNTELVPRGRGNITAIGGESDGRFVVIDDSYNANPASMAAALRALTNRPGPRVAILGEMLELGADSEDYHRALAADCADLDALWCVGDGALPLLEALSGSLRERATWVSSVAEIDLQTLAHALPDGASVLVKGSNRVFWQHEFCQRLITALQARTLA